MRPQYNVSMNPGGSQIQVKDPAVCFQFPGVRLQYVAASASTSLGTVELWLALEGSVRNVLCSKLRKVVRCLMPDTKPRYYHDTGLARRIAVQPLFEQLTHHGKPGVEGPRFGVQSARIKLGRNCSCNC